MWFETAGIQLAWWIPPLVAFIIGLVVSTGGLSGAFVLMPFQISILGFTSPAVTSTNHLYNVISIPSGVYRFFKEDRMVWPLAGVIIAGTAPGVAAGVWIRIRHMPDPEIFKFFVGLVLLFISSRMVWEAIICPLCRSFNFIDSQAGNEEEMKITAVEVESFNLRSLCYRFSGNSYSMPVPQLFLLSLVIGVVGGAYGVGGGALIAPVLITYYRLPVYTTAGATLLGTCFTSLLAVVFFSLLAPIYGKAGAPVAPDWSLGALFGIGGFFGIYLGARLQRYMPQTLIKAILGLGICLMALKYIVGYFL